MPAHPRHPSTCFFITLLASGVATCQAPTTLVERANQSATGAATDNAGRTASATASNIDIDTTAPVVMYSGNAASYTVDQTVNIVCTATDALSGILTTTCADIAGTAWSFGVGATTRSASATDLADNIGAGSTSFTVIVTAASLDNLIRQFFGTNQNGMNGLIAKALAISMAPNANAKCNARAAFNNQVDAKTGNPLTAAQAATLKLLAAAL